jgi:hypothetical protein
MVRGYVRNKFGDSEGDNNVRKNEKILTMKFSAAELFNINIKEHRQKIAAWAAAAWERVPADLIKKGFKQNGISTALDGSEEQIVHIT